MIVNAFIPTEGHWLATMQLAVFRAIRHIWTSESDVAVAETKADWLISVLPDPVAWCADTEDESNWATARQKAAFQAGLLMVFICSEKSRRDRYFDWLERRLVAPLRTNQPELWKAVVEFLKSYIPHLLEKGDHQKIMAPVLITALQKVVRDALIADPAFCTKMGITPQHCLPLAADLKVELGSLHDALRAGISGRKTAKLKLADKSCVKATLHVRKTDCISLELKGRTFSFRDPDILSTQKEHRLRALNRVLKTKPLLNIEQCEWRTIANQRPFTDDEHVTLMTALGATPESLAEALSAPQSLDVTRLMPEDARYYHRLLAPLGTSQNLEGFITNELDVARRAVIKTNRRHALRRIAYSALWQPLIPFDALSSFAVSEVSALVDSEDPFSLLFGFEICRAFLSKDPAYGELGTHFLKKLVAKQAESRARCNMFCACATIAMINIRRVANASSAPIFWARLAALTHAGVLTHSLRGLNDSERFLKWSLENFGPQYTWHGMIDRLEAPRWQPNWINPSQLHAELVGRTLAALNLLEEDSRPTEWVAIINGALEELNASKQLLSVFFPGPFDDFRLTSAVPNDSFFQELESSIQGAARLSELPELFFYAYLRLLSQSVVKEVLRILSAPQDHPIAEEDTELRYLGLSAYIAACARSEQLAKAVINRCLFFARTKDSRTVVTDLFDVITEACAAHSNFKLYCELLSEAAAQLAFWIDEPQARAQLLSIFEILGQRDPKLVSALARASAILRTGMGWS